MKKIILALGLVATTLSFVACNSASKDATIDSLRAANEVLTSENQSKDADIDSLFAMLNEIEDNLSMINSKYSNVQEMRRNNAEGSYDRKKEIREQMSSIENMMADNKAKIARLNNRANELGRKNTDLQAYITRLEERSAAQEAQIAELLTELENNKVVIKGLNKNVSELTASNQQKDQYIAQQIADANRAYFIVGSYDELKSMGIVKKSGGFIGIGRKQGTVADMATEKFTEIDRTKVSTITINKKNAVVISQHPENSYELVRDEENSKVVSYLRILNPTQFWQYTKYLVISTK